MPTVLLLPASFSRAKPKHWNSPRQNPQPEFDLSALQEWEYLRRETMRVPEHIHELQQENGDSFKSFVLIL